MSKDIARSIVAVSRFFGAVLLVPFAIIYIVASELWDFITPRRNHD